MNSILTWQSEETPSPSLMAVSSSQKRPRQLPYCHHYTILFEPEPEGGYHAFCPTLKGCHTQGETLAEAIENMAEAIQLYIDSWLSDQQPLPALPEEEFSRCHAPTWECGADAPASRSRHAGA